MPPDEDGTLEFGDETMAEPIPASNHAIMAHERHMNTLAEIGMQGQRHFTNFAQLADFDYLEGHRQVSLVQALGAREVQSKETPGGPANANKP
jgi:hypothetical protein